MMQVTSSASRQWVLALEAEYDSRREAWSDIQGHLSFLYEQVTSRPGARVLELGVRAGTSTAALLYGVELAKGHLWSVDLERPSTPSWWPLTGRWTLTVGDDLDPNVLAQQPTMVDVLLLDTSHTYDHTLAELDAYVNRMRPGGVVCCHDTELVGHDAKGFGLTGPDGPVRRAVRDFCDAANLDWTERPGSFGMGIIGV